MNRRSILSSLSSMVIAALAWPRRAAAVNNPGSKNSSFTYTTKIYNGSYVQNSLVPGQVPINVRVYQEKPVTLTGGNTKAFYESNTGRAITTVVRAAKADTQGAPRSVSAERYSVFQQEADGAYPTQKTIYVLVSVNPQTDVITFTQAPQGVTW